jgi:hypothetical protein
MAAGESTLTGWCECGAGMANYLQKEKGRKSGWGADRIGPLPW